MTQNKTLTSNDGFEKWYANSTQLLAHSAATYETSKQAWVAAKQETAKEIAELKVELEIAQGDIVLHRYRSAQLSQEIIRLEELLEQNKAFAENDKSFLDKITELQSHITQLREALIVISVTSPQIAFIPPKPNMEVNPEYSLEPKQNYQLIAQKALSATPAQSLQAHDNDVLNLSATHLERFANECHDSNPTPDDLREVAKEIRALKAQP